MTPQRRLEGLVVKAVDDELLIYDLDSHRSHALSPLAAALWRRCDGRQTPSALAQALRVPEVAVTYGLGALSDARLLRTPAPWISRREALRWVGATTLPLVHSIIAPTAAQAQSVITPPGGGNGGGTPPPDLCLPPEFQCATTAQCCAGLDCQDGGFGVTVCLEPSVPSQSECLRLGDLCETACARRGRGALPPRDDASSTSSPPLEANSDGDADEEDVMECACRAVKIWSAALGSKSPRVPRSSASALQLRLRAPKRVRFPI
jgi:hypothetical protein